MQHTAAHGSAKHEGRLHEEAAVVAMPCPLESLQGVTIPAAGMSLHVQQRMCYP